MMRLHDRIAALIRAEGPLRFDRFMEAALYDPEGGYYEREGRVGRGGDFVTGPSWHPAFGHTMARIARRLRDEEGEKKISAKGEEGLPSGSVSYTHLRAHETRHDLVCRLLLEKKK